MVLGRGAQRERGAERGYRHPGRGGLRAGSKDSILGVGEEVGEEGPEREGRRGGGRGESGGRFAGSSRRGRGWTGDLMRRMLRACVCACVYASERERERERAPPPAPPRQAWPDAAVGGRPAGGCALRRRGSPREAATQGARGEETRRRGDKERAGRRGRRRRSAERRGGGPRRPGPSLASCCYFPASRESGRDPPVLRWVRLGLGASQIPPFSSRHAPTGLGLPGPRVPGRRTGPGPPDHSLDRRCWGIDEWGCQDP